ncbi:alpha/beta fold hydrolase [Polaribacter sp.]|jgi:pimeloyl-ACP methyl ester carboxylesterase|uniref:alpha/beta fold hydrolase n=1 Tax=Polaribacter sp. TaxID=1920175 RepID=UPI00404825DC
MKKRSLIKQFFVGVVLLISVLIYQGYYHDIPVENLKKIYANEASKFIEIDGMQVHYKDEGNGFPIVLLHGTAASLNTWDDWTTELSKKYRVIRLDLPAFGITGPNKNADYSIESYTKFLHQFLSKINVNEFYVAGNSLGGNIAWNYSAEHPEKVAKLILIDASGLPTNRPQPFVFKMAKIPILSSLFLYITPKFFIEKNIKEVYADDSKISPELIDRYHKMALREGNRQAFIDRAKTDFTPNEFKNSEKLKTILTPTLLIWGAKDTWIPLENGRRFNNILPNASLFILENSGHVPMEENPKESLLILEEFLANSH